MQPRGRYVKLNAVDYILIVALVLLLLTLPLRGILYLRTAAEDRSCTASVEFVIRRVDGTVAAALQLASSPFSLDGTPLPQTTLGKVANTVEYLPDEEGNMQAVTSPTEYDVHFFFLAKGSRAQDGTFLLFGSRRLSVGDRLTLSRDAYSYTADVISVRIS